MLKSGILTYKLKSKKLIDELINKLSGENSLRVVLVMTLLLLIVIMQLNQFLKGVLLLMIPAGFIFTKVAVSRVYWSVLVPLVAIGFVPLYHTADNHIFLIIYWLIAIAISLWAVDTRENLAFNAKMLIGLCFAFATFWKITSPEFLEGSFFKFTMLTDYRFLEFSEIIGGISSEMRDQNNKVYQLIISSTDRVGTVTLSGTSILTPFSIFMGYWTVFIESWIAIAFLAPRKYKIGQWRDIPLLLFMLTTYPIATVRGFAMLLTVMGFAQCINENRNMRIVYFLVFICVPLFSVPFEKIILKLLQMF